MMHRGFTLIEVLVAIVLIGVVTGLIWQGYYQTHQAYDRAETRVDDLQTSIFFAELLQSLILRIPEADIDQLAHSSMKFNFIEGGLPVEASILNRQNSPAASSIVEIRMADGNIQRTVYAGDVSFRYLDGQAWRDDWSKNDPPLAIALTLAPEPGGEIIMKPYSLSVNLPVISALVNQAKPEMPQPAATQETQSGVERIGNEPAE
ncbi:prepilin-type N-terminal cleavage/methylation domain-containing protein [bacterium]|nr:prepilin-type N-terminal cleavage/methylation domain-containing protein [candidate division CSSED10-310 bacterium]